MKKIIPAFLLVLSTFSCQKVKEQTAQDIVLAIMTNGEWIMHQYIENGTDITSQWNGISFKYFSDYSVNAIKSGSVISTGTWGYNTSDTTFNANFPSTTNDTLLKINGSWRWKDSSPTYVKANHKVRNDQLWLIKL